MTNYYTSPSKPSSDGMDPMIIGIILLIAGIVFFFLGFKWLGQKKLIEGTPTSKARSIAMGPVEVYGQVEPVPGILLKSPVTNKDCVYYRFTIEEYRRGKKSSHWVVIKAGQKAVEFFLKDETGKVLIDSNGAEVDIPSDYQIQSRGFLPKDLPASAQNFLNANGISQKDFLGFNKELRLTEYIIVPTDWLYIMGNAGDNPYVEEGESAQSSADIMIQKGGPMFYISDKSEKELLKSLSFKSKAGIIGGTLAILGGLAIIFLYLRVF